MKRCGCCKGDLPLASFGRNKRERDGLNRYCRKCANEKSAAWRKNNPERTREICQRWYCEKCDKDALVKRTAVWRKNNAERVKEVRRRWEQENIGRVLANRRAYYEKNKERLIAANVFYQRKRRGSPKVRISECVSRGVAYSLKRGKGGCRWESLVGYGLDCLCGHLERQFLPGMTWENYGEWHIDHITPIAAFNFTAPEHIDFQRCWALANLRPLWAVDNLRKGARLEKPFQPSLAL